MATAGVASHFLRLRKRAHGSAGLAAGFRCPVARIAFGQMIDRWPRLEPRFAGLGRLCAYCAAEQNSFAPRALWRAVRSLALQDGGRSCGVHGSVPVLQFFPPPTARDVSWATQIVALGLRRTARPLFLGREVKPDATFVALYIWTNSARHGAARPRRRADASRAPARGRACFQAEAGAARRRRRCAARPPVRRGLRRRGTCPSPE